MTPARWPRDNTSRNQLMVIRARSNALAAGRVSELPEQLGEGDLLVVNDAATLPGLLSAQLKSGQKIEVRLIGRVGEGRDEDDRWRAVVLDAGSWRSKTEDRSPVDFEIGESISFVSNGETTASLTAQVQRILAPRLVELRFNSTGARFWDAIYQLGHPIQYSYLKDELPLWSVQTAYSAEPWAAEMPSAGHALRWEQLLRLRARGVKIASLTHAAGISSSGDAEVDRRLPLPERYRIPLETVRAISEAKRVIAVGTSVVRALEGNRLRHGELTAGEGVTALRLGKSYSLKVVSGILTGVHELGESHFRLLEAFASRDQLTRALTLAEGLGFLSHEFGDSCLILPE